MKQPTQESDSARAGEEARRRKAANRRAGIIIAVMVLLWLLVVLFRNDIRAHWWAYRMARTADYEQRMSCFLRLASLKDRAVPAVLPLLDEPDAGVRSFAVAVLHHATSEKALQGLVTASSDSDPNVRRSAIQGLALRGDPPALESLEGLLRESDEGTAMMAASALGSVPSPDGRRVLIEAVTSNSRCGVRVEAIRALADARATEAVPALIEALTDCDIYEGVTEADTKAAAAFDAVAVQFMAREGLTESPEMIVEKRHVVGECALEALLTITGRENFDGVWEQARADDLAADWRAWWSARQKEP
ncbi:MAG: HEAT repeat domain-containing protein [Phycisphaerales bacterium]|nr:MAG: HEAT repeat domain-containing protein [Phycisphaerales bacterium]